MYKGYNFKFTKSLGQNFLKSDEVIGEILEGADLKADDLVIELGPGMGALTKPAANLVRRLVAIEIDTELIPILERELSAFDNIKVINEDVLKTNVGSIIAEELSLDPGIKGVKVIGNLPYYITTPIIMKLLEEDGGIDSITIMMQKEVADRIKAEAGGKEYGSLSIAVKYYCTVTDICDVPRTMFIPQPKVDSAVLRLDLREEKAVTPKDEKLFFSCIKAAFSQRRKTLANCLSGFKGLDKNRVTEIITEAGISPGARAETLTIEDFARLADKIEEGAI